MNNVDQADQLRGTYRFDHWMKKRKWWWVIWMWGVQLLLVYSYVLYKTAHLLIWKTPKKKILSQYDFWKSIVLEWFGFGPQTVAHGTSLENTSSENSRRRKFGDISSFSPASEEYSSTKWATRVTEQHLTLEMVRFELDYRKTLSTTLSYQRLSAPAAASADWSLQTRTTESTTTYIFVINATWTYVFLVSGHSTQYQVWKK